MTPDRDPYFDEPAGSSSFSFNEAAALHRGKRRYRMTLSLSGSRTSAFERASHSPYTVALCAPSRVLGCKGSRGLPSKRIGLCRTKKRGARGSASSGTQEKANAESYVA